MRDRSEFPGCKKMPERELEEENTLEEVAGESTNAKLQMVLAELCKSSCPIVTHSVLTYMYL